MLSCKQRELKKGVGWESNIQVLKLLQKERMCYLYTQNKTHVEDTAWWVLQRGVRYSKASSVTGVGAGTGHEERACEVDGHRRQNPSHSSSQTMRKFY